MTDCSLVNVRNALKLGTESSGDFRNIVFRNCTISARSVGWKPYPEDWKPQPSAGISLITADGGSLERVRVSGITMTGVRAPLFVRLGRRGLGQTVPAAGELKDISIAHIVATGATWPSSITGIPGHPVSNISLKDIRITGKGGGKAALLSRDVPELERQYPDATMFRNVPAYGLYCRHVNGLRAEQLDLTVEQPDARPALVLDDVRQSDLRAISATPSADGGPVIWLRSVRDGTLSGLRRRAGTKTLVRLSGRGTARVRLVGNDLSPVDQAVMVDPEVDAGAVRVENDVTRG